MMSTEEHAAPQSAHEPMDHRYPPGQYSAGLTGDDERKAAPFSDFIGIPTLWHCRPRAELYSTTIPLSFGFRPLSSNATPLSSKFRLPVLSTKGSKGSSFGLPLLSRKAAPLSSMFGLPLLTRGKRR